MDSDYLHVTLLCTRPGIQFLLNIITQKEKLKLAIKEDTKTGQQRNNRAIPSKKRIYPKTIETMFKIELIITVSLFANSKVYWNGREMGYNQNVMQTIKTKQTYASPKWPVIKSSDANTIPTDSTTSVLTAWKVQSRFISSSFPTHDNTLLEAESPFTIPHYKIFLHFRFILCGPDQNHTL